MSRLVIALFMLAATRVDLPPETKTVVKQTEYRPKRPHYIYPTERADVGRWGQIVDADEIEIRERICWKDPACEALFPMSDRAWEEMQLLLIIWKLPATRALVQ